MNLKTLYPIFATDSFSETRNFYIRYFGFEVVFDTGWYVHLHGRRTGRDVPLERGFMLPNNESLRQDHRRRSQQPKPDGGI